jgi:hypothetical protein
MGVQPQQAYPTVAKVMNRARAFVNDSYLKGAGRILTNTASFSVEYLNAALEEVQDKIGNNGVITLERDNILLGPITPVVPDPSIEQFISYSGFFDGTQMNKLPFLPGEIVAVQKVSERQFGSGLPFTEMRQPQDGLQNGNQLPWLRQWEYRADAIYLVGSTSTTQLKVKAEVRLPDVGPDVITGTSDEWKNTTINILATTNAMAKLVAYHYATARGAQAAPAMRADADLYLRYIVRRYTRRNQRKPIHRQPYGQSNNSLSSPRWDGLGEG